MKKVILRISHSYSQSREHTYYLHRTTKSYKRTGVEISDELKEEGMEMNCALIVNIKMMLFLPREKYCNT